jgi:hypothetical protein
MILGIDQRLAWIFDVHQSLCNLHHQVMDLRE